MERLEPVLKQKFWILLGVALIMSVTGWWMATSKLKADISSRKSAIDSAFGKIPKSRVPNENWIKELNKLNAEQEKAIASAKVAMWKRQEAKMMTWPDDGEFKIKVEGYWAPFGTPSSEAFRLSYAKEVQKVWKVVNPLTFDAEDRDETGKGVVFFPFSPAMYDILKQKPWDNVQGVSSERMWQIKEDLWLLERLFQSITDLNGGFDVTQNEAYIHTINHLQLRGGGARSAGKTSAPTQGFGTPSLVAGLGTSMQSSMDEDDARDAAYNAASSGGPAAGPSAALPPVSVEFDAAEEFGADGSSGGPGSGGGGQLERYIIKEDNVPYKTRGFYLSVQMDHTQIPRFIAELTANESTILPIEVVRVQMSRKHEDEVTKIVTTEKKSGGGLAGPILPIRRPAFGTPLGRTPMPNPNSNDEDRPVSPLDGGGGIGGGRTGAAYPGQFVDKAEEARLAAIVQAYATYNKVIADPNMATVTICGVFILYKKADPVGQPAPSTEAPAATPVAAAPATTPSAATATPAEPAATATPETAESAGEQPSAAAAESTETAETAATETTTTTEAEPAPQPADNPAGEGEAPAENPAPEEK